MAVRAGKYDKRLESLVKAYKFDEKDASSIFCFLSQFKRACNANRVFEGKAFCTMLAFMKDKPASNLTVQMVSYKNNGTTHRLPMAGEGQISTYVEAVRLLLKSYATDSNISKTLLDIVCL